MHIQQPKPEVWNIDLVQMHVARAAEYAAQRTLSILTQEMHAAVHESPIHSPIEAVFLAWWNAVDFIEAGRSGTCDCLTLAPQVVVSVGDAMYRPDFVVWPADTDTMFEGDAMGISFPRIAIELDGHDYHERTREQVIQRNQRDRAFQNAGWTVFHFSGSELVKDPERCVREVRDIAERALWNVQKAIQQRQRELRRQEYPPKPLTEEQLREMDEILGGVER